MASTYYRGKIIGLVEKLFIETGDARMRMINCEDKISSAYLASKQEGISPETKEKWEKFWKELTAVEESRNKKGQLIQSSLCATVLRKKNKSMQKYFLFFLEEHFSVL